MADQLLDAGTVAQYQAAVVGMPLQQIASEAAKLGLSAAQVGQVLGVSAAEVSSAGYTGNGQINTAIANNIYQAPGVFKTVATPAPTAPAPVTSTDPNYYANQVAALFARTGTTNPLTPGYVAPTPTPTPTPTTPAVPYTYGSGPTAVPTTVPKVTPTPTPVIPTVTTPSAYDKTNIKQALNDAYVAKNTPLINQIIAENGLTQASVQAMYGLTPTQQASMLNTAGVNWTPAQSASSGGTFTPNAGTPTANKGLLGVGGNVWDAAYGLVSPYAKIMNQMGTPSGGLLANPYATAPIGSMGGFDISKYDPLNADIAAEIAKAKAAANAPDSSVSPVAYMGGYMDKSRVSGPNPPGPDDGSTNIQVGEYVIKKSSVNKYGKGLLDMINEGTIPAKKIKSLLG